MAKSNIKFKQNNQGFNGKIMIFNSPRNSSNIFSPKKKVYKTRIEQKAPQDRHRELIEVLEGLGMEDITDAQIDSALHACFPDGTKKVDEGDLIKQIFRYLKNNNSTDNVER